MEKLRKTPCPQMRWKPRLKSSWEPMSAAAPAMYVTTTPCAMVLKTPGLTTGKRTKEVVNNG